MCNLPDYSNLVDYTCNLADYTCKVLNFRFTAPILITVLDTVEVTPFFFKNFSPCFEVACKSAVYSKAVVQNL